MITTDTNNKLNFKLEVYEGPLDLLLALIAKNKVSIYDIPISLIFEQYMEYIDAMREMDMEVAGEFINMAAELMLIKSRMILPKAKSDTEEEDPRAALAAALIAYKRAKMAATPLAALYSEYSGRTVKETDEIDVDNSYVAPHELDMLVKALQTAKTSAKDLQGYQEWMELAEITFKRLIEYYSNILSFDLCYTCIN